MLLVLVDALEGENPVDQVRADRDSAMTTGRTRCGQTSTAGHSLVVPGQDVGSGEPGCTNENLRVGCGLSKVHFHPEVLVFHGSARLTVHGRRLIVQRHQAGWPQAHIAAAMGVSRKCVKTWIDRFAAEGEAGLATRSSRPHSMPGKTSDEVEQKVLAARADRRVGPDVLGPKIGVPPRTVSRILRRHGVPYLRELDPITGEVIRSSKQTAVRYERDCPGELVHMDVKKLGRIPDGGGWKAHGRQMGSTAARKKIKVGYDYVHSLVDDHSRLAYSEILPDEQAPPALSSSHAPSPTSPPTASPGSSG